MSDEYRKRTSSYGSGPVWPSSEQPRWPTANEAAWERPSAEVSSYRYRHGPSADEAQASSPAGTGAEGGWPGSDADAPASSGSASGAGRRSVDDAGPATEGLPPIDRSAYQPYLRTHSRGGNEPHLLTHSGAAAREHRASTREGHQAGQGESPHRGAGAGQAADTGQAGGAGQAGQAGAASAGAGVVAGSAAARATGTSHAARSEGAAGPATGAHPAPAAATATRGSPANGSSQANGRSQANGSGNGSGSSSKNGSGRGASRPRKGRFLRRSLYTFLAVFIVLPITAFGIIYLAVDVPGPEEVATEQSGGVVPYFYEDGTEMGRDARDGTQELLGASEIPEDVKHAVYAAEDATFETNPGFDLTAIARAARSQVTGGTGGGSTISQQYIKVATEQQDDTLQRKATELVRAFKLNNQQTKSEIITGYLNTIYLGRGAYGMQAAAEAYFGKDVSELTKPEAAYLAGVIQAPSRSDDQEYAEGRWNYVMGQMVTHGWMSATERAEAEFPEPAPATDTSSNTMSGSKHYVQQRVNEELEAIDYPESLVRARGYQVHTTIDERAQDLAEQTVLDVMDGQPENLHNALVATDPTTGGVLAYYGGELDDDNQRDWAHTPRNPGSTMKAFDFVALLQMGKGEGEIYDGTSPRTFGEGPESVEINNVEGADCPSCTVAEAMERSVNTVFYDMVINDTGPAAVAEAGRSAGISERSTLDGDDLNIAIGGGGTTITPRDMATGFGTFAAEGIAHDSHLVAKITTTEGDIVYQAEPEGEPAFDSSADDSAQIAGNVTDTLIDVLPHSDLECNDGRDCAGKTGTHQAQEEDDSSGSSQAWMAGYTPSLSTAVWVGDAGSSQIRDASGNEVFGSGLPGEIWQEFTNAYLDGTPNEPFADVETIGEAATGSSDEVSTNNGAGEGGAGDNGAGEGGETGASPEPSPQPEPSPEPEPSPSPQPEPSPEPSPSPQPSPDDGSGGDGGGDDDDSGPESPQQPSPPEPPEEPDGGGNDED